MNTARWPFAIPLTACAALLLTMALSVAPSVAAAASADPMVMAGKTTMGDVLTDAKGMTLYIFKKDKPGESVCYDTCAKNWPPLTAAEGMQPMAGQGVTGKLGQIERKDNTYQVTFNGMPLYYFVKDTKPGETNGQNVNGVWFVVPANGTDLAASGQPAKTQ